MSVNLSSSPSASNKPNSSYWDSLLSKVDEYEPLPNEGGNVYPSDFTPSSAQPGFSAGKGSWQTARQALEDDELFELTVLGHNKGGLLLMWNGIGGFIPASQLADFPKFHLEAERIHELLKRVNTVIKVRIIEADQAKNRLIFSERAAKVAVESRESLWRQIKQGDSRAGIITNMTKFGAFVDLGGVEGLIHISELSWSRLNHPSDAIESGQRVTVKVLDVDRDKNRIALSLKRMKQDPWLGVENRYHTGQIVEGVVTNIVTYGAFLTLEDQLEGLIHISQLAEGSFLHPRNVVSKGQVIKAKVMNVDPRSRRIALTLRSMPASK